MVFIDVSQEKNMNDWIKPVTLGMNGISIVPLTMEHVEGLQQAAADGELWKIHYIAVPQPDEVQAYVAFALQQRDAGTRMPFAVIDNASGRVLGTTSYYDIVSTIRRVEIGYTWYGKSVQRTHVNTTCKYLLMQHAFETLKAEVAGWRTDILNLDSQKAIERLGAKKDGVIRHHMMRRDGTVRDSVVYSMLASEWPDVKLHMLKLMSR